MIYEINILPEINNLFRKVNKNPEEKKQYVR